MTLRIAFAGMFIMLWAIGTGSLASEQVTVLEGGLKYQDIVVGTGETADIGKVATIHIVGWLDNSGQKGIKFFDSYDQGQPIKFKVGTERVMKAWNFGVVGMRVGGKRRLLVPAELGYGSKGVEDLVPPKSDLILEIELVKVRQ